MKYLKKAIVILTCVILALSVCACAQNTSASSNVNSVASSEAGGGSSSDSLSVGSGYGSDSQSSSQSGQAAEPVYTLAQLDYSEGVDFQLNPGRGFYYDLSAVVPVSGAGALINASYVDNGLDSFDDALETWDGDDGWKDERQSYVHVCFGLENFSAKMGGSDVALTSDALDSIKLTLDNLRSSKMTATIRFSYDLEGVGYEENRDVEPSLNLVITHVGQIAAVVSDYLDCVYSLDTGMFGPWGEQHTTTLGNEYTPSSGYNYYTLIQKWLDSTPKDLNLLVRTPSIFLNWYNYKYKTGYTCDNIDETPETEESARISCFNDGYMCDKEDCGTFLNREKEVKWLSTRNGMYGGETFTENVKNMYSTGARTVTEAFVTHTTHLNYFYDPQVIKKNSYNTAWKQVKYGVGLDNALIDSLYTDYSYYKYIENHLGYRLILRESQLSQAKQGGKLYLKGEIENVGFAHVTTRKVVYIVLKCGDKTAYKPVNFDICSIGSKQTVSYELSVDLPVDFVGDTKVYMKIASPFDPSESFTRRQIAFCNNGEVFYESLGANLLGSVSISA